MGGIADKDPAVCSGSRSSPCLMYAYQRAVNNRQALKFIINIRTTSNELDRGVLELVLVFGIFGVGVGVDKTTKLEYLGNCCVRVY